MDRNPTKESLEGQLARCRELARQFTDGPTAELIRELEAELSERLQALAKGAP